jgi:hypothetical protein
VVEQTTVNRLVASSNLARGANLFFVLNFVFHYHFVFHCQFFFSHLDTIYGFQKDVMLMKIGIQHERKRSHNWTPIVIGVTGGITSL